MEPTILGPLVVLAILDSVSFGTLLVPVWLLMAPGHVRVGRVLLFLGAMTGLYFGIGLALLLGATALFDALHGFRRSEGFLVTQVLAGGALVAVSFLMDNKRTRARAAEQTANGSGRISRWRRQAMSAERASTGALAALMVLAVTAVLAEIATMVPYLAAIGIIAAEGPGWPGDAALLAGYCLVMILPALLLTAGRVLARSALEAPLAKLDSWLTRHAQSTAAWVIGILGALLVLWGISDLGLSGGGS